MDKNTVQAVTDRLRSQSLDEITNIQQLDKVDDRDSGTESDEELLALTQGMDEEGHTEHDDVMHEPPAILNSGPRAATAPCRPIPCASSPTFRDHRNFLFSRRPDLAQANTHLLQQHPAPHLVPLDVVEPVVTTLATTSRTAVTSSPTSHDCSDYERCSLDFEPGNSTDAESSVDFEIRGRSDDYDLELVELNMQCTNPINGFHPLDTLDKISDSDTELAELAVLSDVDTPVQDVDRSPIDRCGSCGSTTSDDEIRELLCKPRPVKFSTSPPRGVHRLNKRTISPKVFLASVHASYSMAVPRKRHRYGSTTLIQRPHLDFEKMQVTKTRILYSVI